ncbi:MAG: peptide ABC transporter substrate-binding protein [Proteobacteria bacterium]|nr:peptide ABC transporter substrate-binding protein [Pseudomonadota bacterium]
MSIRKKSLNFIAFAALVLGAFQACTKKNAGTDGKKVLLYGNGSEPATIDPQLATGTVEHHIILALYEGLVNSDPQDLHPIPGVAEKWEISKDQKNFKFFLRKNAKWSNGDPVTAHDFVNSWMRILTPTLASEYAYMLHVIVNAEEFNTGKIKDFSAVGVKAIDDYTLEVKLKGPTPYFLSLLTHHSAIPVHKATIEKFGAFDDRNNPWTKPGNFVGNGPYKLKTWELNKILTVEKNPNYWDQASLNLDEIHFFPTVNLLTEERSFRAGELHRTNDLPPHKIQNLLKENPEETKVYPFLASYFFRFNTTRKPFTDKRVRKALSLAINREEIVEKVAKGNQVPAYSFVPPNAGGYNSKNKITGDLETARKLLAEAGFPDGKGFPKVDILYNTHEGHKAVAVAIQEMWKKNLNIDVELNNQEWKVYLDTEKKLQYFVSRAGWVADYNDPNNFLDLFVTNGGNNRTGWSNAAYDSLIKKAAMTADPAARLEVFQDAEKILLEEMPILPIYIYTNKYMLSKKVKGYYPNAQDSHPYQNMDLVE